MFNFRGASRKGGSEDGSERRVGVQNMNESYEIFVKLTKNDKTSTKNKINNEGKLDKILKQMSRDIKLLREEQCECKKEISKLREENENVRKGNEQIKAGNENMREEIQELDRRILKKI